MAMTRACATAELPDAPGMLGVDVDGEPVLLVRTESGTLYAVNDICSHQYVKLSEGDEDCLEGDEVECWLHAARFNLSTGKALCLPATESLDTYTVSIDGDDVLVDVETPTNR